MLSVFLYATYASRYWFQSIGNDVEEITKHEFCDTNLHDINNFVCALEINSLLIIRVK